MKLIRNQRYLICWQEEKVVNKFLSSLSARNGNEYFRMLVMLCSICQVPYCWDYHVQHKHDLKVVWYLLYVCINWQYFRFHNLKQNSIHLFWKKKSNCDLRMLLLKNQQQTWSESVSSQNLGIFLSFRACLHSLQSKIAIAINLTD